MRETYDLSSVLFSALREVRQSEIMGSYVWEPGR